MNRFLSVLLVALSLIFGACSPAIGDVKSPPYNPAAVAITGGTITNISGDTSGVAVVSGKVGEVVTVCTGSAVALTTGSTVSICNASLGAGVWSITTNPEITLAATTSMTGSFYCLSTTTADCVSTPLTRSGSSTHPARTATNTYFPMTPVILNSAAATNVSCSVFSSFTTSTATGTCIVKALRIR